MGEHARQNGEPQAVEPLEIIAPGEIGLISGIHNRTEAPLPVHPRTDGSNYPEPTEHQIAERQAHNAFHRLPVTDKVLALLDPLIAECDNQLKHGGPVSPSIVAQLKAVRELVA